MVLVQVQFVWYRLQCSVPPPPAPVGPPLQISNKFKQDCLQVFATKLESDEKSKAVMMLQRAVGEQRDLTLRLTTEQEKDAQLRLANQKTQYETTIQRHLGFIDQLIADKKELSEKVYRPLIKAVSDSYQIALPPNTCHMDT